MTNWRAVGYGFLVELVIGVVGLAVPGIGQAAAGLVGGFVAGYIARGGLMSGAWHGLLAGGIGGILVAILLGLAVGVFGLPLGPIGPLLGGAVFTAALVVAVLMALDSAAGGAIGAIFG